MPSLLVNPRSMIVSVRYSAFNAIGVGVGALLYFQAIERMRQQANK